jgi:hypothetical protein
VELFGGAARIVDDVALFESGDARRVKPDAHNERPEDEHNQRRENWTPQRLSPASTLHGGLLCGIIEAPQRIIHASSHLVRERTALLGA